MVNTIKNVLITQNQLVNYAGSEIVTLELAEYFSGIGAQVTIATNLYGEPIKSDFSKLKNVKIIELNDNLELNTQNQYDVVWVHHSLIPLDVLRNIIEGGIKPKIIYNHMSYQIALETPLSVRVERELADIVLYNSPETQEEIHKIGFNFESVERIFPNPAPQIFWSTQKKANKNKSILVVSNHPPQELDEALTELEKQGVGVIYRGSKGVKFQPKRITPQDLASADMVITIGKTVQYSLAMGVPVYCYDYFGGPGIIDDTNLDKVMYHNFSGRGYRRKDASEITKEISDFLKSSKKGLPNNFDKNIYNLPNAMEVVLQLSEDHRSSTGEITIPTEQYAAYSQQLSIRSRYFKDSQNAQTKYRSALEDIQILKSQNENFHHERNEAQAQTKMLQKKLDAIHESKSWRIIRKLTRSGSSREN